jgi:3-hydroxybutyryl-CoA dehydrogenase
MDANSISKAIVIGGGTMGHGIAQVLAMSGIDTVLCDLSEAVLERAVTKVTANLDKGVARGKVEPSARDAALARLSTHRDASAASEGAQAIIEAVPEDLELKRKILAPLGERSGPDVLIASNTSSLSLTELAASIPHPERVTGMHFFNPVHIMKLVEVVRADQSSEDAVRTTVDLAKRLGKDPITVIDRPGFASSRLGIAIGMEAIRMVEEGVATAEDIDKAMTLGYGHPMGPLKLTDLVGLDVRLSIAEYLSGTLGERFTPPALLRQMVADNRLGKKNGRGFYDWSET